MYCEITVKHKAAITEGGLQEAVCQGQLGAPIVLTGAYARSSIYRINPPGHSVGAFETVRRCFVIAREVNSRFSTFHIEGNIPAVTVESLLLAVQDFASLLFPVLGKAPGESAYQGDSLTVQLFEDNGRETGIEGKLITVSSLLRERFAWASLRSSVLAFITSLLLIWRGLKQEPLLAGVYSFAIVLVFTVLESAVSYFLDRGKIRWKLRQA